MLRFIVVNDRTPRAGALRLVLHGDRGRLRPGDLHEILLLQPRVFRQTFKAETTGY
jgi:hypothetical protein